jgi:hypothetical protein
MPERTCRRVTIRLYNPEIIRVIESVPRGLRSAVIQSALAAYIESGTHRTLFKNLQPDADLRPLRIITNHGEERDLFTRLTGDF